MYLKPSEIFFSQDSINNVFDKNSSHRYQPIGETLDALCEGRCSVTSIPTISVMKRENKWFTADNRRLWVFRNLERLGKCDEIYVRETNYISSSKFTTYNGGTSVDVRGSPGGIWHRRPSVRKPNPVTVSEETILSVTHVEKENKTMDIRDIPSKASSMDRLPLQELNSLPFEDVLHSTPRYGEGEINTCDSDTDSSPENLEIHRIDECNGSIKIDYTKSLEHTETVTIEGIDVNMTTDSDNKNRQKEELNSSESKTDSRVKNLEPARNEESNGFINMGFTRSLDHADSTVFENTDSYRRNWPQDFCIDMNTCNNITSEEHRFEQEGRAQDNINIVDTEKRQLECFYKHVKNWKCKVVIIVLITLGVIFIITTGILLG